MESIAQSRRACSSSSTHHILKADRFSALPSEIAHHVLSFLHISDLTRVGILSKQCRALYLSSPTLNFTSFPSDSTRTFNNRLHLIGSLDRFFQNRAHNKVQSFTLSWVSEFQAWDTEIQSTSRLEKIWVFDWIENAVSCNVENLDFCFLSEMPLQDFIEETQIEFPSSVFPSKSLRSLKLLMNSATLKAACFSTNCISNLVFLGLSLVTVDDDEAFSKWVSFSCRFLKKLELELVEGLGKIEIQSSSLESFRLESHTDYNLWHLKLSGEKLEDININWFFETIPTEKTRSLEISAPNLKKFKWGGNMMNNQILSEFKSLEAAKISVSSNGVLHLARNVHHFLSSIRSLIFLSLDAPTTKALFNNCHTPQMFHNLQCLHLDIWSCIDDELVPAMASLLKGVHNLSVLHMRVFHRPPLPSAKASAFGRGYWELQNLGCVSQLRNVIIELTDGSNGFEFARYLLEHAQNLKSMIVIYSPIQSNFVTELRGSRIVSSASVLFWKIPILISRGAPQ